MTEDGHPRAYAPLSAAILAGGISRRMGTDKALLSVRPDDPPLLAQSRDRAQAVAADVFIVATGRPEYGRFGLRVIPDAFPDGGTLGGIATAIRHARHDYCLVLACDLPFLSVPLLHWMAAQPRDYDVLAPRTAGASRQGGGMIFHTLHAIYGKRCLPAIEARLAAGQRQIVGFFDEVRVRPIDDAELRAYSPDLRSLFNANSPEALAEARAMLA